jgi:hypothetical protein
LKQLFGFNEEVSQLNPLINSVRTQMKKAAGGMVYHTAEVPNQITLFEQAQQQTGAKKQKITSFSGGSSTVSSEAIYKKIYY